MERHRLEKPRAPGRPRSPEVHDSILAAAIALIREVGYDAVTMEGIASRAGVGKATLYRWWPGKELLVVEALGRIMRGVQAPDTGTVADDVAALMHAAAVMYRDPATSALLSGLVAAMARHAAVADAVRSGFVAVWRDRMRDVLRRGLRRGELRRGLDVELALDLLAGPPFYRFLMLGLPIDDRFVRAVTATVLRGLAPDAAAKPARTTRRRS